MITRRRAIVRTPFLEEGDLGVAIAGGISGLTISVDDCVGTALSAGVVDRKSSSAPGRFALRVIGRNSAGVRLFNVADQEQVVSAVRLADTGDEEAPDGEEPPASEASLE